MYVCILSLRANTQTNILPMQNQPVKKLLLRTSDSGYLKPQYTDCSVPFTFTSARKLQNSFRFSQLAAHVGVKEVVLLCAHTTLWQVNYYGFR